MSDYRRNRWTFGVGTIGRDMLYTLISMFLIVYLTNVAGLTTRELAWTTGVVVGLRVLDAVTDPLMGVVVDNTRTRWGKHKPWILGGALLSGLLTVLIFVDPGLHGAARVAAFAALFFLWSVSYSLNDIAYWSYVPELSTDLRERESIGAKARIFSLVGVFFVVAGIVPITSALGGDDERRGWLLFAVLVVAVLWAGQAVTLLGVREPQGPEHQRERTSFRDFVRAIGRNDQLLCVAVAMGLFMIGYTTTTSFGLFYFQFVYGDEAMFSIFAIVLGVSQIASLLLFPKVSARMRRKRLYLWATVLVVAGYVLFFVAPTGTMAVIGVAGVLIFVGQAAIQLLMLLFLADTVDYGHWKLGKRNDSVTFSLQPFIYKAGGAAATGVVGLTAILTGLNDRAVGDLLEGAPLLGFKGAMLALPLVCVVGGYLVFHRWYRIDETAYAAVRADLAAREGQRSAPVAP
ncbi:glycoside-pentoside-hexuronide (GPH):cation symporter [Xylanimonas ulmi]|uniref:Melibiose permease/lactose/raffinose/galactose permease n=1 Tax=Xylanimonas ulmi TaxID=228973 RepID=A0A4V2EYA2_9MICO|nr:glycoside-pentoside-hexuronide (GPH):cation symporter [Xylanibacterium ulmi]RZS62280.1 melibiose permease/lactose/raffinose/galactose permease [Xylanibacterium ulmi]